MLGPADDRFHPPVREPETWTETSWFAAHDAERGLGIWTYPLFRTGLGVMACTVYVWEPGRTEPWELPHWRCWWHMPIPPGTEPTAFELPNGLRYRTREPMSAYEVAYDDGDGTAFELEFEAVHLPHPLGVGDGIGHIDQLGRVRGELMLRGERIPIDCIEMRDRTWGPRRESRQETQLGYTYGYRDDGFAFHASTRIDRHTGEPVLMTGFVLGDGEARVLERAERRVERDARGRPVAIELTIDGELTVTGEVVSSLSHIATPFFVFVSLVRWTFPDGTKGFGEDQDTWSPALLTKRLFGRTRR